jgi:hypothetical protein
MFKSLDSRRGDGKYSGMKLPVEAGNTKKYAQTEKYKQYAFL